MKITDKYSFYDALVEGFHNKIKAEQEEERKKVGYWRGGSSGCITESGAVLGTDPRIAVLRYLGIQVPQKYDDRLMTDAGIGNEIAVVELLKAAQVDSKQEDEVPMIYMLDNGESVKGRPDLIIFDGPTPTIGIELKLICSPNGAAEKAAWFKGKPDTGHFVQACHYASHFQIPWVLAYTNRVYQSFPYYAARDKIAEQKHMIHPEHRAILRDDKGKPFMIKPFQSFYDITLDADGDTYLLDGQPTLVTKSGMQRYYEYCTNCIQNKVIPTKRSGSLTMLGDPIENNKTLKYYDFKGENALGSFDEWVESCKQIADKY